MGKLFGTDGVRGVANTELTGKLAYQLGQAGAYVLTKETKRQPKIIVARDTRISGTMLEAALVGGICSVGAKAISIGVVPTPAVAYLVRELGADAGVMISASHNPLEFNGIKFFNSEGYKLRDELEDEIENLILTRSDNIPMPTGENVGTWDMDHSVIEKYIDFVCNTIPGDLKGLKVLVDCANGAASEVAPIALERLGADIEIIHHKPNGININKLCGSTHMGDLQSQVVGRGMQAGIAFDGDADRCLAVDEKGIMIDGDQILSIVGLDMKACGTLKRDTIVATVMSNLGFTIMSKEKDINLIQTRVGDRYVLEKMLKHGYNLGGEQSGHVIFLDHNTTGDGLITAIQLLYVMKKTGKPLSELKECMQIFPQVLVNAHVKNENKYAYLDEPEIQAVIEALEEKFKGEGRVLIRPSGTEPLVRVMIEGKDKAVIEEEAKKLATFIEEKCGE
ncbi:phosphoglucosamine mutase [Cellulosilyticum lentocellum]|uniref:Phosphoglucosamine mutase n=1 Tax=Cellulosilyticum lentocellum (strain ATCC 49066 / DSM 5427 / NCIMB 11756 / RHM5) TaxID=642492 RepID=F2JR64_CELLD|nr:phosphoglucosamine mutase [Cellulosilyticum lentocellum]ADZ85045.1 phosphoglucosamine mutase [Cellulosilyticum lentocellum DSM 5427]